MLKKKLSMLLVALQICLTFFDRGDVGLFVWFLGHNRRPKSHHQWWPSTWRLGHPGHSDGDHNRFRNWVPSDQRSEAWEWTLQQRGACSNQMFGFPAHISDGSNVVYGSQTILMHKSLNCFHIFRVWACERSSRPLVIIQWYFAALESCMPIKTPCTTHCFIAIHMANTSKVSLADLPSLTQNLMSALCSSLVHDKITNVPMNAANWYTAWWWLLLRPTACTSLYCHLLACYWSSLRTF